MNQHLLREASAAALYREQRDELLEALTAIATTDPVDAVLDPDRALRIAKEAIAKVKP
jgi:hypothetical protein